jgi:hypothetical protein
MRSIVIHADGAWGTAGVERPLFHEGIEGAGCGLQA